MRPCNQCGKCCLSYADGGLTVTQAEIEAWEIDRPDIYRYVREGEIWYAPESATRLNRCPWLVGTCAPYACAIYEDRPGDCRSYPVLVSDMIRDGCEMIEVKDRSDLDRAQERLDTTYR